MAQPNMTFVESSSSKSGKSLSPGDVTEWLARRDPHAINQLMQWCRPMLRAIADKSLDQVLKRRVDASDMVQETCADVSIAMNRIETTNRHQFWSYLRASLGNKIADARRRYVIAKKRSVYREVAEPSDRLSSKEWLMKIDREPLEQLVHDETCQQIIVALGRLPRELQRVLRWRFRKGWTYAEIGNRVGRSEEDVRMLILRCLASVRREVLANVES